mgnify:CR=1 FL=1
MNYACKSVIGRRRTNEDRCCAVSNARGSILLAVADGMGGHAAGEVASEMLIETLRTQAEHFAPLSLTEPALRNAILEANLSIYRAAEDSESCRSMGSTLVCAVIEGNRYLAANIGDSRLYLYSADRLTRITKDHSLVQTFMDEGSITPDEAAVHPLRNVITRAVGTNLTRICFAARCTKTICFCFVLTGYTAAYPIWRSPRSCPAAVRWSRCAIP